MAQYFKWFLYGAGHHGYLENSAVYGTSDPCRAADGSDDLYEAAKIDGANVIQRFIYVTLPNVKTTVLVAMLFRTLDAFRVFDLISVMTGGANGTESVSVYAYNNLMKFLDFGYGSSLAVLIFVVVF